MDWSLHLRRILVRLGEDATFTHGTTALSVRGIFAKPYSVLPAGMDAGFASSEPRFAAMTADLPSVAQGDTIVLAALLDGTVQIRAAGTHNIVDIQPDDPAGITVLQLHKAS